MDARARLGPRYLSALTNLLRELDRLLGGADPIPQASELRRELETGLEGEQALLYLALVPQRVPPGYTPNELGRLMARHRLFPFLPTEEFRRPDGRPAVFRAYFWPTRAGAA